MACVNCNIQLCTFCFDPTEDSCCCDGLFDQEPVVSLFGPPPKRKSSREINPAEPFAGANRKSGDEIDALRAGRNRALRAIPELPEICTWANLKSAGGGIRPIIGCTGLPARERHHGPNKSTLDNEIGVNLHAICTKCHKRWHWWNDKYYDARPTDGTPFVPRADAGICYPHDPETKATTAQLLDNEIYWSTPAKSMKLDSQILDEDIPDLTEEIGYGTMDLDTEEEETNDSFGTDQLAGTDG